jgi:transposase InsO family protein
MQQVYLDEFHYKTRKIAKVDLSIEAQRRYKLLRDYKRLKSEGCSEATALQVLGLSRATYYRWRKRLEESGPKGLEPGSKVPLNRRNQCWDKHTEQLVQHIRRRNPLWGRIKIQVILRREYQKQVSVSTVGRILAKLVSLDRIKPVKYFFGRIRNKRRRRFNRYAKRLPSKVKASKLGELVQIDHMSVNPGPGVQYKHFKATCPMSRLTICRVYTNANSSSAADFLAYVQTQLPYPIKSIQVDGGSEFMAHFESYCEKEAIPLYVLPPRTPELNGKVERCNGTTRYEFYAIYDGLWDMDSLNDALIKYMDYYNTYRPHQALNNMTPMGYYQAVFKKAS